MKNVVSINEILESEKNEKIVKKKKNDVTDLNIYKQYLLFIYYMEMITEKYPRSEKPALVAVIKQQTYLGMEKILLAYKKYDVKEKLNYLNELDVVLKMIKVLSRVSYKRKFINSNNYKAISKKIDNIGNLLGGWINSCLKV